jgi:maltose/maltodextrin transport system permease protein
MKASKHKAQAWRYLLPGVAAMLIFIAGPLLYTVQIGFTNYSSKNLLSEERARAYLLQQREQDTEQAMAMSLHREGGAWVLQLMPHDNAQGKSYVSPPLALLATAEGAAPVMMQPGRVTSPGAGLADVIAQRDALLPLQLKLPHGTLMQYAGPREFAPFTSLWQSLPDGTLVQVTTQQRFTPDREEGFFVDARGQRLQPGFKVGVGWRNHARMFSDPDVRGPFLGILVWTVAFAGLTVLFAAGLGMLLAMALNWEALRFRTVYRVLLFLPYAVPAFISILVFKGLFNQNFGEINALLDAAFGIRPAWFADPWLAKSMLLMVNVWLGFPYFMILCSGLLKTIPADLYEASSIAGATVWDNLRRITVPLLLKPLTPLLISAFAFNFNNFVLISLLTDGRPDYLNTKLPAGTTDILVSYTYRIAFTDAGQNFGLAAAISTMIFLLVGVLSLVNLRASAAQDNTTPALGKH